MDTVTLVIAGLVAFWVLGFFLKIGGTIIHLLLVLAAVALLAKFLNFI